VSLPQKEPDPASESPALEVEDAARQQAALLKRIGDMLADSEFLDWDLDHATAFAYVLVLRGYDVRRLVHEQ
jgi:hypothetical protein